MTKPVRGLLFDLGGTLFSYAVGPEMGRAIFEAAEALQIEARKRDIGRAWGEANAEAMRACAELDFFLHRDLFNKTLETFAARFERTITPEIADRFAETQTEAVVASLPIRDDTIDTLKALKDRGLYLSIVSNIDDEQLIPLVEKHGLDRVLDDWTSSEEARSCKPHTRIYHYALEKGGLDAGEAIFVGDSLHHDVAGAHAAGIRAARIADDLIPTPLTAGLEATAEPDWVIRSLSELVGIVDELGAA